MHTSDSILLGTGATRTTTLILANNPEDRLLDVPIPIEPIHRQNSNKPHPSFPVEYNTQWKFIRAQGLYG